MKRRRSWIRQITLQRDLERLPQKRTAVVIAHRLATVEASDRILVLRQGRLIEQGTHLELRTGGFTLSWQNYRKRIGPPLITQRCRR